MIDDKLIGAALDRSLADGYERAEQQLDQFIAHRHKERVKAEGERDEEAAWRESERRHAAARRAANRSAWRFAATYVTKAGMLSGCSTRRKA